MEIVFLGTNGWYSTETGSTSCVLIDSDRHYIVFDAGEGIYKLDNYLTENKPVHLFLSHFHLDHVFGFHMISKLKLDQGIDIYGQKGTRTTLNRLVRHPFTVPFRDLPFDVRVHELSEGAHEVPFPVTCRFLVHADPCYGYRLTLDGKIIAYLTDTAVCDNSLELCRNVDLMIHDCASKSGRVATNWPHTTPQEAAELAMRARVKQLFLFHFDALVYPSNEDRMQAGAEARKIFRNTMVSFDGTTIRI
jgi:ribonuclease BN (tRNA processing enzyme)